MRFLAPLFLALVACSEISAPHKRDAAAPAKASDRDLDGHPAPDDCLDEAFAWASVGPAPCDGATELQFWPADGLDAKDFSIVEAGGQTHVVHIRTDGPWANAGNAGDLGHESSADMVTWTQHPTIDLRGPAGDWNDRRMWAPHIVSIGGLWHMYYTGVSWDTDPALNLQRIGLATSTDLFTWTDSATNCDGVPGDGCVLDCDSLFTLWGSGGDYTGDCRDPFVIEHDGGYLMFLTVRGLDGKEAVARASSSDGLSWSLVDLVGGTSSSKAESPAVHRRGSTWYLFWTAPTGVHVATATDPLGSFASQGLLHYGFASDFAPLEDGSLAYGWVAGVHLELRRLYWDGSEALQFSPVVSPTCRVPASSIHPGRPDDPINGIDDNCDGYVDIVHEHVDPTLPENPPPKAKLRFGEAVSGRF